MVQVKKVVPLKNTLNLYSNVKKAGR